MSAGIVYERATWAPRIGALVCGSLLAFLNGQLVPTPTRMDANGSRNRTSGRKEDSQHHDGETLCDRLPLLPTPTAQSYGTNRGGAGGRVGKERPGLKTMARRGLIPTPTASDATGGQCSADKVPSSRQGSQPLKEVYQLIGTPTATDSNSGPNPPEDDKSRLKAQVRGPLNPSLHLWLMGWPEGASDYAPLERESFRSWLLVHGIDCPESDA